MTGPDNQRVCKCQYVCDFSNPLFVVRVLKGRYFYGNCRRVYFTIYLCNKYVTKLTSHWLFGLLLVLILQPGTTFAGRFSLMD